MLNLFRNREERAVIHSDIREIFLAMRGSHCPKATKYNCDKKDNESYEWPKWRQIQLYAQYHPEHGER